MAKRATLTDVSSGYASGETLNNNFTALNEAFDNTLSRDGSTPNALNSDIDMNSYDLTNVGTVYTGSLRLNGAAVTDTTYSVVTFDTRTLAEAGETGDEQYIWVGNLLYEYDASGTALTTGDSRTWSPSGNVYPNHFAENTTPGTTDMASAIQLGMSSLVLSTSSVKHTALLPLSLSTQTVWFYRVSVNKAISPGTTVTSTH